MSLIKIRMKDLRQKTTEELNKMKKEMKMHLIQGASPKNRDKKGFNPKEERKNIARIGTILKERNK